MIRLVVDLSNKSAQLIDDAGRVEAHWSGVTREPALLAAQRDGWVPIDMDHAGKPRWFVTSPPDGFWCRMTHVRRASNGESNGG